MKMKNMIIGFFALLLAVSMVLAADPDITDIGTLEFTEGINGQYQVAATDDDGHDLMYELQANTPAGMEINETTGRISWTPGVDQQDVEDIELYVYDVDEDGNQLGGESLTTFNASILPTLDFTKIRIGKVGLSLEEYEDGDVTEPFKPGDNLTIELTAENRFTDENYDIIERDDVAPTIENIALTTTADVDLTDFPDDLSEYTNDPLFLTAEEKKVITFNYQIPYEIGEGDDYSIDFEIEGDDLDIPSHTFDSVRTVNLSVEKSAHDVLIRSAEFSDNELTCEEKQDVVELTVEVVNIGSADEDITIQITNPSLGIDVSSSFTLVMEENIGANDQAGIIAEFDLSNVIGTHALDVKVFRTLLPTVVYDTERATISVTDCGITFINPQPAATQLTIGNDEPQQFSIEVDNPDNLDLVKWFVTSNGEEVNQNIPELEFEFNAPALGAGTYEVKVQALAEGDDDEDAKEHKWTVTIVDRPSSTDFTITDITGLTQQQLASVANFFIQNSNGKILFTQPVSLQNLFDIDGVVRIESGLVAIDSANAAGLNKAATITLNGLSLDNPIIKQSTAFTTDATEVTQICDTCTLVSSSNGTVIFTVPGFSTYKVVDSAPAELHAPAKVEFPVADRNATVSQTLTITNAGTTESLINIIVIDNAHDKYQVTLTPNTINTIPPGVSMDVQVTATIPIDQDSGLVDIGDITITADGDHRKTVSQFLINARSGLEIEEVNINDKTSGKLKPNEGNEVEVKVKNTFNDEIEDVSITATIIDVDDGDDLDETSDEFDLRTGKDNTEQLMFNIPLDLNEDNYLLEIEVEGTDKNGALHKVKTTKQLDVERETHQLIISETTFPSTASCNLFPTLYVEAKNIGESDEDDVTIKVTSSTLGISMQQTGIEIDKYSSSDNDQRVNFNLNLANANQGTHTVTVEVYRNSHQEDTKQLSIAVEPCVSTTQQREAAPTYTPPEETLQQLPATPQTVTTPTTVIESDFRGSDNYVILLGMLVFLTLFAVLLGMVVLAVRRR